MKVDIQYLHSETMAPMVTEIKSLCEHNGYELVSVFYDGKLYHAFLKLPKS